MKSAVTTLVIAGILISFLFNAPTVAFPSQDIVNTALAQAIDEWSIT